MTEYISNIYIHLPFCRQRCSYCDFYSEEGKLKLAPLYIKKVIDELAAHKDKLGDLKTVYVGGGTPALLDATLLGKLFEVLNGLTAKDAETTIEVNPSSLDLPKASALRSAGFNRVSLGVQSFSARLRKNLGRRGEAAQVYQAVKDLRESGFDNIGIDLIFGIPEQTLDDLNRDLDAALSCKPEHISYYELSVIKGGNFERCWKKQLAEAAQRGGLYYKTVTDTLINSGFKWYETSNFALPGRECRHNMAYWEGRDYIGIGAGAWSTAGNARWRNAEDIGKYIELEGQWEDLRETEKLSDKTRLAEKVILGLRTASGVDMEKVRRIIDIKEMNLLCRNGFLSKRNGILSLTHEGHFMANEVIARILKST